MDETTVRALAATVLAGIAPEADLALVGDDDDLREALDLDSMDFMNFVVGLAERTGRDIADADTPRLHTMGGLVRYFLR
jgi:acyl carrier protein